MAATAGQSAAFEQPALRFGQPQPPRILVYDGRAAVFRTIGRPPSCSAEVDEQSSHIIWANDGRNSSDTQTDPERSVKYEFSRSMVLD